MSATKNINAEKIQGNLSLDSVSGVTISGGTIYSGSTDLSDLFVTSNVNVQPGININTGGTASNPIINLDDDISLNSISTNIISGGTFYGDGSNLSGISTDNFYVTGGTFSSQILTLERNDGNNVLVSGFTDFYTTGGTYDNNTSLITFERNDGNSFDVDLSSIDVNDTFVTGQTFNSLTYNLSTSRNDGITINTDLSSLASDVYVVSGIYDILTGIVTYTNSTGGTFQVSGFTTGMTDSYTTAANLNGETIEFDNNIQGGNLYSVNLSPVLSGKTDLTLFDTHTGDTNNPHQTSFNNLISTAHTHTISDVTNLQTELDSKIQNGINSGGANEVFSGKSGTDLYFRTISGGSNTTITTIDDIIKVDVSIPIDTNTFVTGGTFSSETLTLDRNDGGSVVVTGFTTGGGDNFYVTGFTYDDANTFTISRNGGLSDLSATINTLTGLTIDGVLSASTYTGITLNDLDDVTTNIPATPDNTYQGRLLYFDAPTNQWLTGEEYVSAGNVTIWSKKGSAGTIDKGCPVYITGFDNDIHEVELANASTGSTMPVIGFTAEDFDNAGVYPLITFGKLSGIDTTSGSTTLNPFGETWEVNDVLYMSKTDGGLTKFRPTGTNTQIQRIAKVLNVGTTNGQIFIFNTARTAGLPNLTTGYLWVGNGDNLPQEVIRTDVGITTTGFTYNDNNTFTITDDNGGSLTSTFNQVSGLTINGDLDVTGDTTLNTLTASSITSNSAIDVFNGHINLRDNSYFLQGRTIADVNVSLIGVDNQDRVFVGNAGYDTYIDSDTIVDGSLTATTYYGDGSNLSGTTPWSQSGTSIYYNDGNVGIGVSDPTFNLDIVSSGGTSSFEDIARFRTIDSTDYLAITNAVSTDGSFNPVFRSFNNTNTSTNLYIQSVIDPSVDTGVNPLIMLQGRVTTNPGVDPWSGVTTRPIVRVRNNSANLLDVTADGKVGIGTITPSDILEVTDGTTTFATNLDNGSGPLISVVTSDTDSLIRFGATDGTSSINVGTVGTTYSGIQSFGVPSDSYIYSNSAANGLNLINGPGTGTEDYIRFYAGGNALSTSHLHIQGSGSTKGYIGIGTETPTQKLHIYDSVANSLANFESGDERVNIRFNDSLTTNTPVIGASGNTITFGHISGGDKLVIDNDGYVGVGVETPSDRLSVSGSTGQFRARVDRTLPYTAEFYGKTTNSSGSTVMQLINDNVSSIVMGVLGSNRDASVAYGGESDDTFMFASTAANNLHIFNGAGTGTEDSINFYAGNNATATPHLHIHGSGSTKGYIGVGIGNPQYTLDVLGETRLSGSGQNVLTIIGSSSTDPLFTVQGSAGELFSITDNLTGTLFAVNDISGLPILEVNSDDEILMGNYQAPSLNTTFKTSITSGLTELYSIPLSAYTGGFFEYTLTGTGARAGSIMSIFSGSSVNYTETTTTDIGDTSPVTFDMNVSGGTANLTVSATTGTWEIKTIVRSI